jgi:hypothetical protein
MNFHIVINGVFFDDEQEIRTQVGSLLMDDAHFDAVVGDLIEASTSNQPSEFINQWTEREPGLCSCLAFQPVENRRVEPAPETTELAARPLNRQLATVAATGLMSGLEDHVIFPEDGLMVLNAENPPDVTEAGEIVRRLFEVGNSAKSLDEFGKWNMGSFLDSCFNLYGDNNFSVSQFVEETDENYNTTVTCLATYRAFAVRRYTGLSFTHHKEALYAKFPGLEDEQRRELMHRLLRISERFELSCAKQRKLFSYARNLGAEQITHLETSLGFPEVAITDPLHQVERVSNPEITNSVDLVDRITLREANRNYLFKFQDTWYHYRGISESIPVGAAEIICTDNWSQVQGNTTTTLPTWERPGTEAE